jgi:putative transposase
MEHRKAKKGLRVVGRNDQVAIKAWLAGSGQALLPMLELIENTQASIDELMHEAGRTLIEQILLLSAQEIAGEKQRGKAGGAVVWHGTQGGVVALAERKLQVKRPRLRNEEGEVAIPAYDRLRNHANAGKRVRDILVAGVSTRKYASVLPEAAGTVGVSKSAVSRQFVEASATQLAEMNERRLDAVDLLVIYMDGVVVARHHVLAAVGVDLHGSKHLLGLTAGASENAEVVKDLLNGLIARGLRRDCNYLFVIDGSKALRAGITEVFGTRAEVQRCRTHKMRNVLDRLPKEISRQVKAVMQAAYKLSPKEGMAKLMQQAQWLKNEYPDAAASLLEGLDETFTVNRLGLTPALIRCLATTNIIENPNGIVRTTSARVKRYRDVEMVMRWTAAGFLEAEKSFRKIQGVKDLWILQQALKREVPAAGVDHHAASA